MHWETWLIFGVWLVIGLAIYYFYVRKHSGMNPNTPRHEAHMSLQRGEPRRLSVQKTREITRTQKSPFQIRNGDK